MPDNAVHSRRPPASVPAGAARETRSRARCLGYIAVGTATILALVAIVLPTLVAKSLVKFPDRIHQVTVATGTGDVQDFRQLLEGTVHIDHEVPVQLTTLVNSVVPTDSNVVTLCVSFEVTRRDRTDTSRLLDASVDQVTVSRTTGMPQRRPAMTVFELDQKPLETVRHGLQYKFPFGTAKRDHPYFDAISQRETTMAYVDDSRSTRWPPRWPLLANRSRRYALSARVSLLSGPLPH